LTLNDLRRYTIRTQVQIQFALSSATPGGSKASIDAQGLAKVAGLDGPTLINLESELALASQFVIQPTDPKLPAKTISRAELEKAVLVAPNAQTDADHHDEE